MQMIISGRTVILAIVVLVVVTIGAIVVMAGTAAEGRIGIIVALIGPVLIGFMQLLRQDNTEAKVDRIDAAVNGPASAERILATIERERVQKRDHQQDSDTATRTADATEQTAKNTSPE